jgi:hypothetical protein
MKKLIALLAMVIFCVSLIHAENVPNPFKFGFNNRLKIRHEDDWRMDKMRSATVPEGTSPLSDATPRYASLEETMTLNVSATINQMYTMAFSLSDSIRGVDILSNGASSSLNRAVLGFVWSNKIVAVKDYLTISVDAGWTVKWDMDTVNAAGTTAVKSMGGDDRGYQPTWEKVYQPQNKLAYEIPMTFGLSGKVGSTGFSWGLSQSALLLFNAEFYKDNDPQAKASQHGEPFTGAAAGAIFTPSVSAGAFTTGGVADKSFGGFFESYVLTSRLQLAFEFFHFFAPANITATLKYDHKLGINCPVSYYYEIDKEIQNDMQPSIEFGFFGAMKLGLGARIRHYTFYNTSAPVNDSDTSPWNLTGSTIRTYAVRAGQGGGFVFDCPSHQPNVMRVGPTVGFSVGQGWFEIGGLWYGFARDFLVDVPKDGSTNFWRNDFEMYATFKL